MDTPWIAGILTLILVFPRVDFCRSAITIRQLCSHVQPLRATQARLWRWALRGMDDAAEFARRFTRPYE